MTILTDNHIISNLAYVGYIGSSDIYGSIGRPVISTIVFLCYVSDFLVNYSLDIL